MAEICKVCGAELAEEAAFCSNCGAAIVPEPPVTPKKKVKWWMIAAPIVVVILVCALVVGLMWDAIYIRIAPTAVLAEAIGNTVSDLSARSEGTVWPVLAKSVDEEGRYTMELDMALGYDSYLTADAALVSRNDIKNAQFQSDMELNVSLYSYLKMDMNFGMYADRDGVALNWEEVFGDTYYGVYFDSFGEDVRGNAYIRDLIGEDTLAELEETVQAYREQMEAMAESDGGYEFSEEYRTVLAEFFKAHKPVVEAVELPGTGKCWKITYSLTDEELADLIERLGEIMEEDEAFQSVYESCAAAYGVMDEDILEEARFEYFESIQELADSIREADGTSAMSFWLYNDRVVNVEYSYVAEDMACTMSLELGENAGADDIIFRCTYDDGEESGSLELIFAVEKDDAGASESISILVNDGYDDTEIFLGYEWDKDGENLTLMFRSDDGFDASDITVDVKFCEEENGFTMELPEVFELLAILMGDEADYYREIVSGMSCTIGLSMYAGAEITKPEYTNIRELTEEQVSEMEDNLNANYGLGY